MRSLLRFNPAGIPVILLLLALLAGLKFAADFGPKFPGRFPVTQQGRVVVEPGNVAYLNDFMIHWNVARQVAQGHPEAAYDRHAQTEMLVNTFGMVEAGLADRSLALSYMYPPPGILAVWPFGYFEFRMAAMLFLGFSVLLLTIVAVCYVGGAGILLLFGSPALWICLWEGQNGIRSAAMLGAVMLLLPRYKVLSGLLLGTLGIKPHLVTTAPFALAGGREGRAFLAAGVGLGGLLLITTLLFGPSIWSLWWTGGVGDVAGRLADPGNLPRLVSLYASLMLSGVPQGGAIMAQVGLAAFAVLGSAWLFHRTNDADLRTAALALAGVMVSPLAYDYDLALTLLALLALLRRNQHQSLRMTEWGALVVVWLLPGLIYPEMATTLRFNPVPLAVVGLFVCILRQGYEEKR